MNSCTWMDPIAVSVSMCGRMMGWWRSARRGGRVHAVQPGLERRLALRGVDVVDEQVRAQADDAAVVVATEEAVQAVGGADAEELGRRVVDDALERAGVAERRVDLIADACVRDA